MTRRIIAAVAFAVLAAAISRGQIGKITQQDWVTSRADAQRTSWIRGDAAISLESMQKAGFVFGSGSGIIRHHMEIRGLGIINIKDLFGIAAVRETKKLELVVELVDWHADGEYDRLGLEERQYRILDIVVPQVTLPVRPGRNIATIIEVAARNQLLKLQGHNSAKEFQERLNRAIAEARPQSGFDVDGIE